MNQKEIGKNIKSYSGYYKSLLLNEVCLELKTMGYTDDRIIPAVYGGH